MGRSHPAWLTHSNLKHICVPRCVATFVYARTFKTHIVTRHYTVFFILIFYPWTKARYSSSIIGLSVRHTLTFVYFFLSFPRSSRFWWWRILAFLWDVRLSLPCFNHSGCTVETLPEKIQRSPDQSLMAVCSAPCNPYWYWSQIAVEVCDWSRTEFLGTWFNSSCTLLLITGHFGRSA